MKTLKHRIWFAVIWSVVSVLRIGLLGASHLWATVIPIGFHFPVDWFFETLGGIGSEKAVLFILPTVLSGIFIILWIIALSLLKNKRLFEWLIIADRAVSVILYFVLGIVNSKIILLMCIFRAVELVVWAHVFFFKVEKPNERISEKHGFSEDNV